VVCVCVAVGGYKYIDRWREILDYIYIYIYIIIYIYMFVASVSFKVF
jgi:hypothetical protein